MSSSILTPLASLRTSSFQIPAHNLIPNTSIQRFPFLIYHSAVTSEATTDDIEQHLRSINVVKPSWRYTMYQRSHFHSTTHELLVVSNGRAKLLFGGEDNPGRIEQVVEKGDVMIVPAGVGHRLLEDLSISTETKKTNEGFEMVGCYPVDAEDWDMCYGEEGERDKVDKIRNLNWFDIDPVYGGEGPATQVRRA